MIELKIDNKRIAAEEGETVLQAAVHNGIDIPHFCYHPCLSIAGNCRICLVKVDGRPKLMPACNLRVAAEMEVETDCEEVQAARREIMQFVTLNHPGECGICDKAGECRLQDYQERYGSSETLSIEAKDCKQKFHPLGERILLDRERCILCSRCVRFTQEVSGSHMLGIVGRGAHAQVERLEGRPFADPYCDNVIGICPTGALFSPDFLYKGRVWQLEPVRSVCPGCSRTCSIQVWRRQKQWHVRSLDKRMNEMVYRVTPLENEEVNGPWICNRGYDLPKLVSRKRVLQPMIGDRAVSVEEALEKGRALLAAATKPAAVVSAQASNEEMEAFRQTLASRLTVYTGAERMPEAGEVIEDDLLVRADKSPNRYRLQSLFGDRPFNPKAGHDLVLVWGDDVDYAAFGDARIIHLASFQREQRLPADLLIPVSTFLERSGSFCNFEGKTNRFDQVFEKPEMAFHAGELFGRLEA